MQREMGCKKWVEKQRCWRVAAGSGTLRMVLLDFGSEGGSRRQAVGRVAGGTRETNGTSQHKSGQKTHHMHHDDLGQVAGLLCVVVSYRVEQSWKYFPIWHNSSLM